MPDSFRAGMEVELTKDHLAKLMPFFDLKATEKIIVNGAGRETETLVRSADYYRRNFINFRAKETSFPLFENYLRDHPKALSSLPTEIQEKLTEGLQLDSLVEKPEATKLEVKKPSLTGPSIIKPKIILPDNHEILVKDSPPPKQGLILPKRLDWEKLHERWAALTNEEKAALVQWEYLSPFHQAELVVKSNAIYSKNAIPLREDLPVEVKTFFQKLEWEKDGDALEFRHKEPVKNPQELLEDIKRMGRYAGVSSKLENSPDSKLKGISLHYHLSVEGRDFKELAEGLNELLMIKRVKLGIISDLTRKGEFIYQENLKEKGLLRLINRERLEIRAHPEPLEAQLSAILKLMKEENPKASLEELVRQELKNMEVVELIQKYRPILLYKWRHLLEGDYSCPTFFATLPK